MNNKLESLKQKVQNLPEFSEKNYPIAGYVAAGLITVTGLWLVYEVIANDALSFKADWNMFGNAFGNLCFWIGMVCAIAFWGKFVHWSSTPVLVKRDRYTGKVLEVKEDYDITEQGFAKILMPIIGHFIIEPIIYGALIYYPVQCVIAVLGAIFPYIMSLIILAVVAGSWMYTRVATFRYRSVLLVFAGVLFTVAFGYGAYSIHSSYAPHPMELAPSEDSNIGQDAEQPADDGAAMADEQVAEEGEEMIEDMNVGLFGSIPDGTSEYVGTIGEGNFEMTITKNSETMEISCLYKNTNNGETMEMYGESLPSMNGDINFFGGMDNSNWSFMLTGTADNITGTANNQGTEYPITMHRK